MTQFSSFPCKRKDDNQFCTPDTTGTKYSGDAPLIIGALMEAISLNDDLAELSRSHPKMYSLLEKS